MRTFCFKCKLCGHKLTAGRSDKVTYCNQCEQFDCLVRDYKAEAVGLSIEVLRAARG